MKSRTVSHRTEGARLLAASGRTQAEIADLAHASQASEGPGQGQHERGGEQARAATTAHGSPPAPASSSAAASAASAARVAAGPCSSR